jgi:hypothetical protein
MPHAIRAALLLSLITSCATLRGIDRLDVDRGDLVDDLVGRELLLAASMYVTRFPGSEEWALIDPRPRDVLDFRARDGSPVTVKPYIDQVLYAGTPVRVVDIVFPQSLVGEVFDGHDEPRPTAHTWVVLERLDEMTRPLVTVMPRTIQSTAEFLELFHERAASRERVSTWLDNRSDDALRAIRHKELIAGLTEAEMIATLGRPKNQKYRERDGSVDFVADYGRLEVTLVGRHVHEITDLDAVEAERERLEEIARLEQEKRDAEEKRREEIARARAEARERRRQAELDRKQQLEDKRKEKERLEEQRRHEDELRKKELAAVAAREKAERDVRQLTERVNLRQEEMKHAFAQEMTRLTTEVEALRVQADSPEEAAIGEPPAVGRAREVIKTELEEIAATVEWVKEVLEPRTRAAQQKLAQRQRVLDETLRTSERRLNRVERRLRAARSAGERTRRARRDLTRARANLDKTRRLHENRVRSAQKQLADSRHHLQQQLEVLEERRNSAEQKLRLLNQPVFGMIIAPLPNSRLRGRLADGGAEVVAVAEGGAAFSAGVRARDVIVSINGEKVHGPVEMFDLASRLNDDERLAVSVVRNGKHEELSLPAHLALAGSSSRRPVQPLAP